jgi:hypothetical protein
MSKSSIYIYKYRLSSQAPRVKQSIEPLDPTILAALGLDVAGEAVPLADGDEPCVLDDEEATDEPP